jgi:hypothetical protein
MKKPNVIILLSGLTMLFALIAACAGSLWQHAGHAFSFTTLRGQMVQIHGQGLYRYDTPIVATGFRMADWTTLIVAVPLAVIAIVMAVRGSLKGGLLLAGCLRTSFTTLPRKRLARPTTRSFWCIWLGLRSAYLP